MEHKVKKYELSEDTQPAMVGESPAALQQYADDLRYGMEVLSSVSPERLHNIVVLISDYAQEHVPEHQYTPIEIEYRNRACQALREIEDGQARPIEEFFVEAESTYPWLCKSVFQVG